MVVLVKGMVYWLTLKSIDCLCRFSMMSRTMCPMSLTWSGCSRCVGSTWILVMNSGCSAVGGMLMKSCVSCCTHLHVCPVLLLLDKVCSMQKAMAGCTACSSCSESSLKAACVTQSSGKRSAGV